MAYIQSVGGAMRRYAPTPVNFRCSLVERPSVKIPSIPFILFIPVKRTP